MKGKIMMMTLLCALLVGLVPPRSAHAEDVKVIPAGDYVWNNVLSDDTAEVLGLESKEFVIPHYLPTDWKKNSYYQNKVGGLKLALYNTSSGALYVSGVATYVSSTVYYDPVAYPSNFESWGQAWEINPDFADYKYMTLTEDWETTVSVYNWFKKNVSDPNGFLYDPYAFEEWCGDAGLNCQTSSASSALHGMFEYNGFYSYIVTGCSGNYSMAQIYCNDEIEQFTEFVSYDNKLYLHLKDDISGTAIFVKRFGYDVDGWSAREADYYTLQYGELVDLGITVSADNMLYYSNRTVKTGELYGNVYYEKSTEFTEGFAGEASPDHESNITPSPSVPSPDVGYDVYIYKPSLNGKVNADSVNMRELPSVESVAVASFIKTWSLSVQGYCYDNDGVIWYLCTTERDGVTYTGYMQAKYIKVESYGGIDVNFEGIDVEDIPEVLDTAKDSLLSALDLISVVPLMMGAVFGFLPSWCLLMVGATFVIVCIVGIIKVFRG